MDVATFKTNRPEFAKAATPRIQAAIDACTRRVDAVLLGSDAELAIELLTAHMLAMGPSGREARFKDISSKTVYLDEYERVILPYAAGQGITP